MTRALVAAVAGVVATCGSHVIAIEALSLEAALTRARTANPELAGASAGIAAARGRLAQASVLAANPVVTPGANQHRIPGETNIDASVSIAQEIQVGGQRGLRMSAARFEVERAERLLADRARLVDRGGRRA